MIFCSYVGLIGKEVPQWKTYLEIKPALLL